MQQPIAGGPRPAHRTGTWSRRALVIVLSLNLAVVAGLMADRYSRTQPQFCAACHIMKPYADSYLSSSRMDTVSTGRPR